MSVETTTRVLLFAAALLALDACADDPSSSQNEDGASDETAEGGDEGPWESLDERPCPPDSTVDGLSFGAPFMLTWCNGCHGSGIPEDQRQGAPLGVDFDSLDEVRMHADRIWARAADDNETMPPAPGPSEEERRRLGEWLACGAPYSVEVGP